MKKNRINFLTVMIGNALEHYDKALFAFLAPFLAPFIFQHSDPVVTLISTYLILPLGLISKPIGALIFGRWGDKQGRKKVFILTLLGMAITTVLIGTIPLSQEKRAIAPLLFALGSLFQNFFASGETTGGALLVLESSPQKKRGLINALYESSTLLGILFASIGVSLLSFTSSIETHWRVLYWLGGGVGGLTLIIRFFAEPPLLSSQKKEELFSFLWQERRLLILIILTSGFSYANYYMLTSFLNGFLPLVSPISSAQAMQTTTSLLALDLLILLFSGGLTLYFSKETLLFFFAFLGTILAVPLYAAFAGATLFSAACMRLVFLLIGVGFSVILFPFYQDQIPKDKRFTLIAFGNALGSQIFGTSASPIGFWLYKQTRWPGAPGLYLMGLGLSTLWALSQSFRLFRPPFFHRK